MSEVKDSKRQFAGFQPRSDQPFDLAAIARLNVHTKKEYKTITQLYDITLAEKLMLLESKQKALDALHEIMVKERELTNELIRLDTNRNLIIFQAIKK